MLPLKNFIATVEWDDVADNITTGLNTMIHETNEIIRPPHVINKASEDIPLNHEFASKQIPEIPPVYFIN